MELIAEILQEELNSKFEVTEKVVSVFRKRDVKKVEAVLYFLNYKYATHEAAGNHFEIIYNS